MRVLIFACGFFVFAVGRGLAQAPTTAMPVPSVQAFLREVSSVAAIRGTDSQVRDPKEVLGLDEENWGRLRAVADDLRYAEQAIAAAEKPVVLELRLAITGGEDVSSLRQRVAAFEALRERTIAEHVERFKRELAPQLAQLQRFIEVRADQGRYFPGRAGVPTPVKGKAR